MGIGDGGMDLGTWEENMSGGGHNQVFQAVRECQYIFIPCWQDPADFENLINETGGGTGEETSLYAPWRTNYDSLVFCNGVDELLDVGPNNPIQPGPNFQHPNYDFCSTWMKYLEDCILPNQPDFTDINNMDREEMMMRWAHFQYEYPEQFAQVISNPNNCTTTAQLEDYMPEVTEEDCVNAMNAFMSSYNISLTKPQRDQITNRIEMSDCGNQPSFDRQALFLYVQAGIDQNRVNPSPDFINAMASLIRLIGDGSVQDFNYLINNPQTLEVLVDFVLEYGDDEDTRSVIQLHFLEQAANLSPTDYGSDARRAFIEANEEIYAEAYTEDTGVDCCLGFESLTIPVRMGQWHQERFTEEVAILKEQGYNTDTYSNLLALQVRAELRVLSGTFHFGLDILGMLPAFGIVADGVNSVFYLIEGDGLNATISALAMIPVVGEWAITARYYKATVKYGDVAHGVGARVVIENGVDVVKFRPAWNANKNWKKWWGFTGENIVGHHIIPKRLAKDNPVLQKAAKAGDGNVFHPHDIDNGIPMSTAVHNVDHFPYNNAIRETLEAWYSIPSNRELSPEVTADIVKRWQQLLREQLENPNLTGLNDITIPDLPLP